MIHQNGWRKLENIDKLCFACGSDNHFGLKMRFAENGKQIRSDLTLPEHTRGWHNLVHGGILATILDETLSWTAIQLTASFVLTRRMTIEYRRPVRIGADLTGYGQISKQKAGNLSVEGEIYNEERQLCCMGKADFAVFDAESFARLNIVPEQFISEMQAAFAQRK